MGSIDFDWILNGLHSGDPLATVLYGPLAMVLNMLDLFEGGLGF